METCPLAAIERQRSWVVVDVGESISGPEVLAKMLGELSKKDGLWGLVLVLSVDVREQSHSQIRFSVHSLGQSAKEGLSLTTAVEGIARDQDAIASFPKELLDYDSGASASTAYEPGT
jgi:hypothetical protein